MSAPSSRPGSRPTTPLGVEAKDIATVVDMPHSRPNSTELFEGHRLELIDANEKVHPHHDIVKDRRTGKHYKKVTPAWSMAHAKQSAPGTHAQPQAQFSVGHSFGGRRDPGTAGSRPGTASSTRTTPPVGVTSSLSAADVAALVERLRVVVREEVSVANRGHAEHLEKVVNELEVPAPKPATEGVDVVKYTTSERSEQSDISSKGGAPSSKAVLDPAEAERGVDGGEVSDADEYEFPNPWAKIRYEYREYFAEFLGCWVLMTFGDGINVQALFSSDYDASAPKGNYLSVSFGWGIAVALAVYCCGGISGHINPAVTLTLAMFRKFPWKKVPGYMLAQILGAVLGALCIYGMYHVPILQIDPAKTQATAQYFTTYPAEFIRSPGTRLVGIYNEIYATMILLIVILAINDGSNTPPPDGMAPIVLLWLITGIGATMGWQTAYAINPARDLGPRIALSFVGYRNLWGNGPQGLLYWLYTPVMSPMIGGPLGALVYDILVYTGSESPINRAWRWSNVRWRPASKQKIPAGIGAPDGSKHA